MVGGGRGSATLRFRSERTRAETNAGLQTQSGFLRFFPLTEATGKVPREGLPVRDLEEVRKH